MTGPVGTWRRTPLWLRLISAMLVLAALGLTLTGAFGVQLLRGYLTDRTDEQLQDTIRRVDIEDVLGASSEWPTQYYMAVLLPDGRRHVEVRSTLARSLPEVPSLTVGEVARLDGEPFTVDARDGDGRWRMLALPTADNRSVVLGTSLDEVDATVSRLIQIDVLAGLGVLAGLAIVGYLMVRTALRPLAEIELTAAAIGRGDLARRVPDHHPGTEMGRLSRALNAMLEQIERGFRARAASEATARRSEHQMRQFVADASHELRTPLTSIRGFAELHRQGAVTDPDEVSRLLGRIEDEATRMGVLVEDLLLLARLDQPRPLQRAPVDLAAVVRAATDAIAAAHPDRTVTVTVGSGDGGSADGVPGDGRLVVTGDEARLHQVVRNLVDNALAYSPPAAPVTVRVARVERDGRSLASVEVVDRGPGLTPEQAARVFERFYRTDAARSRAQGGTGLGLSIVQAIVHRHGGTVEVESAPGEGSTFRVLVPLAPPAVEPPAVAAPPEPRPAAAPTRPAAGRPAAG